MHNERAWRGFRQKDKKTDFCRGASLKLDAWDKNYGFCWMIDTTKSFCAIKKLFHKRKIIPRVAHLAVKLLLFQI